jgi:hypothetical protein
MVTVSLVRGGKLRMWRRLVVPALAVRGLQVPGGVVSAMVTTSGAGVVAEESTLYGKDRGYTIHAGQTTLSTNGYLLVPGADGSQGYVMLLNPDAGSAHVTIGGPGIAGVLHATVRAGGEALVRLTGWQASGVVHLIADRPVASAFLAYLPSGKERSLARDYRGSISATLAAPAPVHVFAEGDTRLLLSDPQETLLLANPGVAATKVRVTELATGGHTSTQTVGLSGGGTATVLINGIGPPSQHGLVVTADHPVLAARSIDFNGGMDALVSSGVTP